MSLILDEQHKHHHDRITQLANGLRIATRAVDPALYHPVRSYAAVLVMAGVRHAPDGHCHALEHMVLHEGHQIACEDFGREYHYDDHRTNASTSLNSTFHGTYSDAGTLVAVQDLRARTALKSRLIMEPDFSPSFVSRELAFIAEERKAKSREHNRYWAFNNLRVPGVVSDSSLGSLEEIAAIRRGDLVDTYERLYVGANVVVPMTFPSDRNSGQMHEALVEAVERSLGGLPAGSAVYHHDALPRDLVDYRVDANHLEDSEAAVITIGFHGVTRFSASHPAQTAFIDLFATAIRQSIEKSQLCYEFGAPHQSTSCLTPGMVVSFQAGREQIKPILDLVTRQIGRLATSDLTREVDFLQKAERKSYTLKYNRTETCSERLIQGLLVAGKPVHPEEYYHGVETITARGISDYARTMVHSPIALWIEIGTDGDPDCRYAPSASEFACSLRRCVPKPDPKDEMNALLGWPGYAIPNYPRPGLAG